MKTEPYYDTRQRVRFIKNLRSSLSEHEQFNADRHPQLFRVTVFLSELSCEPDIKDDFFYKLQSGGYELGYQKHQELREGIMYLTDPLDDLCNKRKLTEDLLNNAKTSVDEVCQRVVDFAGYEIYEAFYTSNRQLSPDLA